ncbi:MAG TPA: ABC transporter ATP-binding protein/permease [Stellaceae bacterium]|nr:ABC transporter ATP-binding protein/permease [Stellaceae bacterium]
MTERKRSVLRDAWRLAKPYWQSDDKRWAWSLLIVVVTLNLGLVYINVRLNEWRNDFYNALQNYDEKAFFYQLLIFSALAAAYIICAVYQIYLQQMLQIRWRRWLTRRYLDGWLGERAYYRLQLAGDGTDNPDQRISEDVDRFTRYSLALSIGGGGFLNAGVTLVSFVAILWSLSGPLTVPLGSWGSIAIPGYMVWFAILYAVGGTWLTVKIGRPLVRLNFDQQRYEADFRFSLVRLRENTESVALYGGEPRERLMFLDRFGRVVDNFWNIMKRIKTVGWWTSGYGQFAVIFPYIVAAPAYFAKTFQLGGLMQTAGAFDQVQSALSFIVTSYAGYAGSESISEWQSVVQRLGSFEERMREVAEAARAPQMIERRRGGDGLEVADLDIDLPNGSVLLRSVSFTVAPNEALLLTGPTGSGKSTLLRAIAGIWPFGRGRVRIGEGRTLFLPQRPYLPLGTLRNALLYPREDDAVPDERLKDALETVGLSALAGELDEGSNWARRLSLGEQQRLAFARILLGEPAIVFLDEATSALDEASETELYRLLRAAAWRPTVISVGHRSTLRDFHDRILSLDGAARREKDIAAAS